MSGFQEYGGKERVVIIENILGITLVVVLMILSWQDMREKKIDLRICAAETGMLIFLRLIFNHMAFVITGGVLGIVMLILAYISRQAIGYGDGCVFVMTGVYLGGYKNFLLIFLSLCIAALYSGVLLFVMHKSKNYIMPFLPCILLGFMVVTVIG